LTYGYHEPTWSYTHNNEYLAHPWGAGFTEVVGFVNYRWKRIMFEAKFLYGEYQEDYLRTPNPNSRTHLGKDPLRPEGQFDPDVEKNPARHVAQDFRLSYVVNPSYNMMINVGYTNRMINSREYTSDTGYLYFGLRTFIDNQYFDF